MFIFHKILKAASRLEPFYLKSNPAKTREINKKTSIVEFFFSPAQLQA